MSSQVHSDVVVVGAGIIGAACAYHLAAAGRNVTVVDAFDGPAEGSSGRSFACVRGQWADELNIDLSWRSICTYRRFQDQHGLDVGYRPNGYLILVPHESWAAHLDAVEVQRAHGVRVDVLDLATAAEITPFDATGIGGATFGRADGVVDPHLVTTEYLSLARARGARVMYRHRVTLVEPGEAGGGWQVRAGTDTIHAQYVVNAAGGWAGELAALAGITTPVVHSRRNIYASTSGGAPRSLPMTVDSGTGLYLRSEGNRLLIGVARPDEVDGYNVSVDWPWLESVLSLGVQRFPWVGDVPIDARACWAGTYENTPDQHGILGPDPGSPTWISACGFSGHGVMQAPEIGRLVAEQIVTGVITSVDVTPLRPERFRHAVTAAQAPPLVF